MLNRRNWVVALVALLLVGVLAGCAAGVAVPEREVEVSVDTALEAQNKLAGLMMAGEVDWSESEFSSLLSVLLDQNSGENNPVEAIHVWFEPGNKVIARIAMLDGVLPEAVGDTLELAGTLDVEDGKVVLNLDAAGAGALGVSPALLAPISAQINAALAGLAGVPVDVETEEGSMSVSLGM